MIIIIIFKNRSYYFGFFFKLPIEKLDSLALVIRLTGLCSKTLESTEDSSLVSTASGLDLTFNVEFKCFTASEMWSFIKNCVELKGALNDPVARRFLIVRLLSVVVVAGFTVPFPESDTDPDFLVEPPTLGTWTMKKNIFVKMKVLKFVYIFLKKSFDFFLPRILDHNWLLSFLSASWFVAWTVFWVFCQMQYWMA